MKHLKQKLYATLAMLMVATTMLATSTYAWFAISNAPEVSTITTLMEASGSLEIALGTDGTGEDYEPGDTTTSDSGDDTTWGATVSSVTNEDNGIQFPITYDATEKEFQAPVYDATGRISELDGITLTVGTYADGIAPVTADITIDEGTTTYVVGTAVLLWLRSNVDVTDLEAAWAISEDSDLADDVSVAFLVGGSECALTETDPGALTANAATAVEVIIYVDGANITAEAIAEGYDLIVESIKFTSEDVTDAGTGIVDGYTA